MPRVKTIPSMQLEDTTIKPVIKKAVYSGAIGAAGAYFLFGEKTGTLDVFGMALPSAAAVGVACSSGSVVSDLISGYVIEGAGVNSSIQTAESTAVKLGISGLATMGTLSFGYGLDSKAESFILGAGAKLASDTTYATFDSDLLGMLF